MVIVSSGEGCSVYEGTFELAKKILDSYIGNICKEVIQIADSYNEGSTVKYVSLTGLARSLLEVYNLDEGQIADRFSRYVLNIDEKANYVPVSEAMKTELAVWMMKNKLTERDLSSPSVSTFEKANIWGLKMLEPLLEEIKSTGREIKFCDYDAYFETARQYRVIKNERWKENATEKAKINYVLNFINDNLVNSKYEDGFELCEVKSTW